MKDSTRPKSNSLKVILCRMKSSHSVRRMMAEAKLRGESIHLFSPTPSGTQALRRKMDLGRKLSLLPRIGVYKFEESLKVLRSLEFHSIKTLNSSRSYVLSRDKWQAHRQLEKAKIPTPKSWRKGFSALSWFRQNSGQKIIFKPLRGSQGKGHRLLRSEKDFLTRKFPEGIFQEFIPECRGQDVRVLVLNGKILGAVERIHRKDFRANAHRGSVSEKTRLNAKEKALCLKVAKSFALNFVGIDFLRSQQGPLVIDVNPCPGFEAFEKATGVNVAGKLIEEL